MSELNKKQMPFKLWRLIALRYVWEVTDQELVNWAVSELEKEQNNESLQILAAALTEPLLNSFEINGVFRRIIEERGYEMPQREEALYHYAQDIAHKILKVPEYLVRGCYDLSRIARYLNYPEDLVKWSRLVEDVISAQFEELSVGEVVKDVIEEAYSLIESSRRTDIDIEVDLAEYQKKAEEFFPIRESQTKSKYISTSLQKGFIKGMKVKFGELEDGDKFRDETGAILSKFPYSVLPVNIATNAINEDEPDKHYYFLPEDVVEFYEPASEAFPYHAFDTTR